ncbi:MAG TPA: SulP family inorganic anion transporter [Bryobacteraceae bacterium]|jgi:SulP family sulfate permease|nr:SulP family inorganic anion transporter [Bryobacteraceae bacterium]
MSPPRANYRWDRFVGDCAGGLIAALIALPYGLALASAMGLPPVLGIFTSILTAPIISLMGRNPVLIGGTASATVPFIALAARHDGIAGAARLTIMASVFLIGFGMVKLGRHITRVPHAVVTGFSCGIGGMMLVSQLDIMFGVASPLTRAAGSGFGQLAVVLAHLSDVRAVPLVLGLTVIVAATVSGKLSRHAPAPLIGVGLAVLIGRFFGFHTKEVGTLSAMLPPVIAFKWSLKDTVATIPSALGLAFVSAVNILITSRVVEHFRGRHKRMKPADADAELSAYGAANIIGGIFGAPPSIGIPARSLAVVRCGGTTRISNLMHALFLILILSLGTGFVEHIPVPALAGVTAWMGLCLLDWSAWRRLPKMARLDALAFLVTAFAVMSVNAVLAVAIGCSLYAFRWLYDRWVRRPAPIPVYD